MINPTKRQRLTPLSPRSSTKAKQTTKRTLSPERKKLQEQLLETWNWLKSLGVPLDPCAMSIRAGFSKSVAVQYLNGHTPLNTDAMLWFAREMKLAPQEIWPEWQWHDLTASPTQLLLQRSWAKLGIATRNALNTIVRLDGTLRYANDGTVIHILPGRSAGSGASI